MRRVCGAKEEEEEERLALAAAGEFDADLLVDVLCEVEDGLAFGPILAARSPGSSRSCTCAAAPTASTAATASASLQTSAVSLRHLRCQYGIREQGAHPEFCAHQRTGRGREAKGEGETVGGPGRRERDEQVRASRVVASSNELGCCERERQREVRAVSGAAVLCAVRRGQRLGEL